MVTTNLKLTWLTALMAIGWSVSSWAQTEEKMYVYSSDGVEQDFDLDNLRKITFSEQGISIFSTTDELSTIPYNSMIAFKSKSTAITEVEEADIKLYWLANDLMVESNMEMSVIDLYNLQGTLLVQKDVKSLSATIPLSSRPTGLYIVRISTKQGVRMYKVIKK